VRPDRCAGPVEGVGRIANRALELRDLEDRSAVALAEVRKAKASQSQLIARPGRKVCREILLHDEFALVLQVSGEIGSAGRSCG